MSKSKKIISALLYPPLPLLIIMTPLTVALLVCSMVLLGSDSIVSYVSYPLSFYVLAVWCVKIPSAVKGIRSFLSTNKHAVRWRSDARFRIKTSLYASLSFNAVYCIFQLWLGIVHKTFWFFTIAVYYAMLAIMRFFLLKGGIDHTPCQNKRLELRKYVACGWVMLFMNVTLSVMVFFMIYWGRTFNHHAITTIAMAAYTFSTLTFAIIGLVKYKKYDSPIFSAAKAIGLASACVSMLTLEASMLTAFGESESAAFRAVMLGATGAVVCGVVIASAIYMIFVGTKKLKETEKYDAE